MYRSDIDFCRTRLLYHNQVSWERALYKSQEHSIVYGVFVSLLILSRSLKGGRLFIMMAPPFFIVAINLVVQVHTLLKECDLVSSECTLL